jgi:hypothetical protein
MGYMPSDTGTKHYPDPLEPTGKRWGRSMNRGSVVGISQTSTTAAESQIADN